MSKFQHDIDAAELRQKISTYDKPWYKSCFDVLKEKRLVSLKALDLCCGNGEFSDIMRDNFGMDVTCADYIPSHIIRAKENGYSTFHINFDSEWREIEPIAEEFRSKFDLIVNLAAIEHIFNTYNLLNFCNIVLKPGGFLLVNTPNFQFLGYQIFSFVSGRPFGEGHHVRFWNFRFLRTTLFLFGFGEIEDYRGFHSIPYDPMLRACRNHVVLASILSSCFRVCKILHRYLFLRGVASDELTVLCRKQDAPVIGTEISEIRYLLQREMEKAERAGIIARLKEARYKGWLDEHLRLAEFVDEL